MIQSKGEGGTKFRLCEVTYFKEQKEKHGESRFWEKMGLHFGPFFINIKNHHIIIKPLTFKKKEQLFTVVITYSYALPTHRTLTEDSTVVFRICITQL